MDMLMNEIEEIDVLDEVEEEVVAMSAEELQAFCAEMDLSLRTFDLGPDYTVTDAAFSEMEMSAIQTAPYLFLLSGADETRLDWFVNEYVSEDEEQVSFWTDQGDLVVMGWEGFTDEQHAVMELFGIEIDEFDLSQEVQSAA